MKKPTKEQTITFVKKNWWKILLCAGTVVAAGFGIHEMIKPDDIVEDASKGVMDFVVNGPITDIELPDDIKALGQFQEMFYQGNDQIVAIFGGIKDTDIRKILEEFNDCGANVDSIGMVLEARVRA